MSFTIYANSNVAGCVGTDYAYMSVSETVIAASKYKRDALTFNLASMALNNHFFLDQLV